MALYNLSDEHVANLKTIIANTSIKGSDAAAVLSLMQALSAPINADVKTDNIVPLKTPDKGVKK